MPGPRRSWRRQRKPTESRGTPWHKSWRNSALNLRLKNKAQGELEQDLGMVFELLFQKAGNIIGAMERQVIQIPSEFRAHVTFSLELNSVLLETDHKVPGHELAVQLDQILVRSLIPELCWAP